MLWAQDDVVMKAMHDELSRSMDQLQFQNMEKPYFISYRIEDVDATTVSATLGSLTAIDPGHRRALSVELRVGDYTLDNSNYFSVRTFSGGMGMFRGFSSAPLDNDYLQVRRQLWLTTDAQYKKAIEDLSAKRAALQGRKSAEEIADFSKEPPATFKGQPADIRFDVTALEQLARELSLPFKQTPDIVTSSVQIDARNTYARYLNSEGSSFTRPGPQMKLSVTAETQAADGLPMRDSIELYGRSIADLPSKEDLVASVREMGARLEKLREATAIEHYNGPVLFEDRAAAEIFAQAFAPGLVTSRTPVSDDPRFELFFSQLIARMGGGDSLLNKIGGRVLPDFVDLVDDPRIEAYQGMKLMGSFDVDDDGVPSRETRLVEKGMLKAMLASRVPVQSISHSTGSRRGFGPAPGNLILSSQKTSSREELRQELLRRVKLRGLRYGIVVRRVGGNAANSLLRLAAMMGSAQSAPSNTLLEVYKIFPDGQEEPVRGMELEDVTSASFRDIVAVGDKPVVYNEQFMPKMASIFAMGMSGATTDLPVVSFVVPSLLFEEITLTKATGPFPNPPTSKAPLFDH
jgi:predicted Zn-dependent protease